MRKEILLCIVVTACMTYHASTQGTEYFLGAGSLDSTITVSTSHNAKLYPGVFEASGAKTVDGSGMNAREMDAARFLAQATLGYTREMIDEVVESGFETWIDSQFVMPAESMTDSIESIYEAAKAMYVANGGDANNYTSMPNEYHMDYTWWQVSVRSPNALRHRVAEALSQIIVVSLNSNISNKARGMAYFFDILVNHAFGNYEDILQEVAVNPAMGMYLTFVNNPATDSASMMFPDENFARECMQLFTIGLDELNLDGTPVLDTAGNRIPTYDNDDIAEFAKIFTGLSYGARLDGNQPYWGMHYYNADLRVPMIMYEEHHEPGAKYLLNGTVIPDGQTGLQDIEQTMTHLFNHPNVGPFIAYRLIQRLVKSNPTPSYVSAVASAFNDNGSGERGDMKAVIKAILLHPEARSCSWSQHPEQGQLREPILRKTQFVRLFEPLTPLPGKYWNFSYWYNNATSMHPLRSPSVFNF